MDREKDNKRRNDEYGDYRKESRHKRRRTRSRSPNRKEERDSRRKRRHSRSKSPNGPSKQDKRRDNARNAVESKPIPPPRKAKETDMLNTRTGGAYIPPARLRLMQAQITDKSSVAYQRLAWEALKKSIHGHINKINVGNIGIIIKELLKENIVRGRGLLCRSVIQAQAASPTFTNVYAALVAAVNSRFPNIGELLLKRLVIQFKRGFKRNDKPICISSASFIAHLVNQKVAHEILALELLTLLVETPTDDSVEVAIAFLKECGQKLTEVSSKGVNAIFEMLRNILHEGQLDKRVQYMIEVMFQVWKDGFKDHPAVVEELELVPEEEQFTHLLMLDDATDAQDILNVFKFDEKYEQNEEKYKGLSKEILGSDAESGEEDGSGESGSEESDDEEENGQEKPVTIIDNTETNLVALRRTIYLTINSSLDFEECAHKLMKMQLKPGQEIELCHMFLDCCAEQRTYEKFYGLLAQRFCNINRIYIGPFEEIFKDSYSTAHRLDTNRLRNVSKFFAHLFFTDSISWEALECVKLNEEDTTSSSRIYIKILFQELAEYMGLKKLNDRLKDPTLQEAFLGVFPRDNPKNTRFSINFFTSIGLGGLTDELREHLKQMPKNIPPQITEIKLDSESDSESSSSSSSDSSSSSSDSSSSDSDKEKMKTKKEKKQKNKTKQQTSESSPKEADKDTDKAERWGHDGFYDTYGRDAKRTEPRSDRPGNPDDNFRRPREDRDFRRNDRRRNNYDQRNGTERYDRNGSDKRREKDADCGNEFDNYRRDGRRSGDVRRKRDNGDNSSRRRENRDREKGDRTDKRDETEEKSEVEKKRENEDKLEPRYKEHDINNRDYDRNYDRSRSNRDRSPRDEHNGRVRNQTDSEYSSKKDQQQERPESKYEDNRRNNKMDDIEKGRDDRVREERNDRERNSEHNAQGRRDEGDHRRKHDRDDDDRKGRERDEARPRKADKEKRDQRDTKKDKNNEYNIEDDSKDRRVKPKADHGNRRINDNDDDRARSRNLKKAEDDSRDQVYKSKHKKDVDEATSGKKGNKSNKKSDSSDENASKNRCEKDKKRGRNIKDSSKISKSKKRKNKRKKKENITDESDSDSGRSREKHKKSYKDKKRQKGSEDDSSSDSSSDSDQADQGQKDLGGRYWDSFDLESKNDAKEKFESRTPEPIEGNYERRRER